MPTEVNLNELIPALDIQKTNLYFCVMETMILHPKNKEQLAALKAVAKALKIAFETDSSSYNPVFVAEVLKGEKAKAEGKKGLRVDLENLWK